MDGWLAAYLGLSVAAVAQSALLTVQAWEHRRYTRSRLRQQRPDSPVGRVLILAPCKGRDVGLAENLRPLLEQDHGDYQLAFIVESLRDPACEVIRRLIAAYPAVDCRLIVAGSARDCGQKVHNLLEATRQLPRDVAYLVFVDSDARPKRDWLRRLVERLDAPGAAAATAYRWFMPERDGVANRLLTTVNGSLTALACPCKHHLVWGGSWAIRRDVFERIGLRAAWQGTLSDDLVAAGVLARAGERVDFEPAAMVASPLEVNWRTMFGFLRRQYTICRCYAKKWWLLCLLATTIGQAAFWTSAVLLLVGLCGGAPHTALAASQFATLYGLHIFRAWVRQDAARRFLPHCADQLRAGRAFDMFFGPLAALVSWFALVSSIAGRSVQWRGIRYRVASNGSTRIVHRGETSIARAPHFSKRKARARKKRV